MSYHKSKPKTGTLALSRKGGQKVHIVLPDGRTGVVEVVECGGQPVKLGFTFPNDVVIVRDELNRRTPEERALEGTAFGAAGKRF